MAFEQKGITIKRDKGVTEVVTPTSILEKYFLDSRLPIGQQPEKYADAVALANDALGFFSSAGYVVLGSMSFPMSMLIKYDVVPEDMVKRIDKTQEERGRDGRREDHIRVSWNTVIPGERHQVELTYVARFGSYHEMRSHVLRPMSLETRSAIFHPKHLEGVEGPKYVLPYWESSSGETYHAIFRELWEVSREDGIREANKWLVDYHSHRPGFPWPDNPQGFKPIPMFVDKDPSARAINRSLVLMFGTMLK